MRILRWFLCGVVVVILATSIFAYSYLKRTLPDYDGGIAAPGIEQEVEIIRDSYGMPHIYAQSDSDAYFALGYSMAQDRLFQMDMLRRAVRGRLSEVLGEDMVEVDKLFRTITAAKSIEDMFAEQPPEVTSAFEAYAAGVNFFLETHKGPLPIEFILLRYEPEPWRPSDCMAGHYYLAWGLNVSFRTEMLHAAIIQRVGEELASDLFIDFLPGYPNIIPEETGSVTKANTTFLKTVSLARKALRTEGTGASNNWVVSGRKAETGMPLLANDPHLPHGIPGVWYEAHMNTPDMNVSGMLFPGIPFVMLGANSRVAWSVTSVEADDSDYYIEKVNPDNPDQYEYMGRWMDMEAREEVIRVKDAEDMRFKVRLTCHGPVVSNVSTYDEAPNEVLSMRWIANEFYGSATALRLVNQAKTVEDIEQAMQYFKCPGTNYVYADDQGNIGYWTALAIPIRDGFYGNLPVPGWDGKHEWSGYVPTHEQPHLNNTKLSIYDVSNAENSVWHQGQ